MTSRLPSSAVRILGAACTLAFCVAVAAPLQAQSRRLGIPGSQDVRGDLLILRSGRTEHGQIKVCDSDSCRLAGKSYAREEIAWIGLAPPRDTPPGVVDGSEDEVHLRDGTVHKGHLTGISLGLVEIQPGEWDRELVTWIHLAGAPAAPPSSGAIPGQEATPSGGNQSGDQGKTGNSAPGKPGKGGQDKTGAGDKAHGDHPPPPPPPPKSASGKRGHLWSGEIHIHYRTADNSGFTDEKTDVSAHLREYRYPLLRPTDGKTFGTLVQLEREGQEIRTKYESDSTGTYAGSHCQGSGTLTQTSEPDTPGYGHGSVIWISNVDADTTPWTGFPIVRGSPLYSVQLSQLSTDKFTVDCLAWRI